MRGTGRAANVYWRATGSITVGTNSVTTVGTHLAQGRISSNVGAEWNIFSRNTVTGRLISLGGSVDLVRTTVTSAGWADPCRHRRTAHPSMLMRTPSVGAGTSKTAV